MNNTYNLSTIIDGFNELCSTDAVCNSNILKLTKTQCRTNNLELEYTIISYDKHYLCADLIPSYGLCRSIIINHSNKVVGFSPPKSIPTDIFMTNYPKTHLSFITAEEFVEGTMINVFYDNAWEISTRNTVGAFSSFYKTTNTNTNTNLTTQKLTNKSFRQMFMEASTACDLDINKLNKELSYSFVLQHPENRIVVPFNKPALYLVGVYKINHLLNDITVNFYKANEYKQSFADMGTSVKFPEVYEFNNYAELIDKHASMNTPYHIVGVVIHNNSTGERTKIRNPVYEQVRNLKGNQPKLQYQYLCLRREGKVKDYLAFYPENKKEFSGFRDQLHCFTDTLYSNYVACYIKKERPLMEYPDQYRTHMFNIHQHYMNELRERKLYINNFFVQKYVNEQHPSLLMYHLNLPIKKRFVDAVKIGINL